uniref:Uncharacterized protein n=1 Tax=Kalanchoe fedtschenkoi TaxID=63787 RepID=A0A7N0TJK1_KALFE
MSSFYHLLIFSAIILLLSWGAPQVEPRPTLRASMADRYKLWMAEHNKFYHTETEQETRFRIFQENVNYIVSFNAAGNRSYTLGVNQFTDLTNEERLARFTGYQPPRVWNASTNFIYDESVSLAELPPSWDWREKGAVTRVKSQTCGNCWLFAGVAEVESVNFIAGKKLEILSEQEIMDCDDLPGKGGCNGGWVQEVYEYVKHYSLTTEANYPNKPEAQTCNRTKKAGKRDALVKDFVNMPSYISDEELMKAVVQRPVVVGIDVSSPDIGAYKSGVFTGKCDFKLNHAMVIVGYGESDDGMKYWIMRNSWSAGWGDGGYIKIQRGTGRKEGLCGINLTPSYPVV